MWGYECIAASRLRCDNILYYRKWRPQGGAHAHAGLLMNTNFVGLVFVLMVQGKVIWIF